MASVDYQLAVHRRHIHLTLIVNNPYLGKFTVEPGSCVVQFLETNPYVTVGTAIAAFYLPVTIMIILYARYDGI